MANNSMSDQELQTRLHSQDFLSKDDDDSSQDTGDKPQKKPAIPEKGDDVNSMDRLMKKSSSELPKLNASNLKTDHPYGDGGYSEAPSATMIRLGHGRGYGE